MGCCWSPSSCVVDAGVSPLLSFAFAGEGVEHRGPAFRGAAIGDTPSPSKIPWDLGGAYARDRDNQRFPFGRDLVSERARVLGTEHARL